MTANHGGRNHDSRVLQDSSLWQKFEVQKQLPFPGAVLLGDSGYPLREWLITPFLGDPEDPASQRFNSAHSKTRCIVEQTFGILKTRFYCLKTGLRIKDMTLAAKIIIACGVLHNICLLHGEVTSIDDMQLDGPNQHTEALLTNFDSREQCRRLQILNHFQRSQRNR